MQEPEPIVDVSPKIVEGVEIEPAENALQAVTPEKAIAATPASAPAKSKNLISIWRSLSRPSKILLGVFAYLSLSVYTISISPFMLWFGPAMLLGPPLLLLPTLLAVLRGSKHAGKIVGLNIFALIGLNYCIGIVVFVLTGMTSAAAALTPVFWTWLGMGLASLFGGSIWALQSKSPGKPETWPLTFVFWVAAILTAVFSFSHVLQSEAGNAAPIVEGALLTLILIASDLRVRRYLDAAKFAGNCTLGKWESTATLMLFTNMSALGGTMASGAVVIQLIFATASSFATSFPNNKYGGLILALIAGAAALFLWIMNLIYTILASGFLYRLALSLEPKQKQEQRKWLLIPRLLPGLGFIVLIFATPWCLGNPTVISVVQGLALMIYSVLMKRRIKEALAAVDQAAEPARIE